MSHQQTKTLPWVKKPTSMSFASMNTLGRMKQNAETYEERRTCASSTWSCNTPGALTKCMKAAVGPPWCQALRMSPPPSPMGATAEGGSTEQAETPLPNLWPSLAKLPILKAKATRKKGWRTTPAPTRPTKRFSSR